MAKSKLYYYIIDKIKDPKPLIASLQIINYIDYINYDKYKKILKISSKKNPENDVKIACDILFLNFRIAINEKHI